MLELDPTTGRVATKSIIGEPVSFVATARRVVVATNGVSCGPLLHAPGVRPQLTVVSEFPNSGADGARGAPFADATLATLRTHGFRAGRFTVGYRFCDYGMVDGSLVGCDLLGARSGFGCQTATSSA